jgi:peptidoglycan/xylan/chitin deacetylase (PgdA/CDA1 family)
LLACAAALAWPLSAAAGVTTVDHPRVDGTRSFDRGSRSGGQVALTFDADMTPGMLAQLRSGAVRSWYNQDVKTVLDSEQVPATIFLTGLWTSAYPDQARALAADPLFEIGDHTTDHYAFRTPCYGLPQASDRRWEITDSQREIAAVTGLTPRLLRFPGDCWNQDDVSLASGMGLYVLSGDVRSGDGFNRSAESIVGNVLGALKPGSIVVMHIHGGPNAPMTAVALRPIIQAIRQRGLGFATVSRLLGLGLGEEQSAALDPAAGDAPVDVPSPSVRALAATRQRPIAAPPPVDVWRSLPDGAGLLWAAPALPALLAVAIRRRRWLAELGRVRPAPYRGQTSPRQTYELAERSVVTVSV